MYAVTEHSLDVKAPANSSCLPPSTRRVRPLNTKQAGRRKWSGRWGDPSPCLRRPPRGLRKSLPVFAKKNNERAFRRSPGSPLRSSVVQAGQVQHLHTSDHFPGRNSRHLALVGINIWVCVLKIFQVPLPLAGAGNGMNLRPPPKSSLGHMSKASTATFYLHWC